jgi:hypothetical protein
MHRPNTKQSPNRQIFARRVLSPTLVNASIYASIAVLYKRHGGRAAILVTDLQILRDAVLCRAWQSHARRTGPGSRAQGASRRWSGPCRCTRRTHACGFGDVRFFRCLVRKNEVEHLIVSWILVARHKATFPATHPAFVTQTGRAVPIPATLCARLHPHQRP